MFNILVVEDDYSNRIFFVDLLGKKGYKVSSAEDGDVAIAILKREDFNLVLLDIKMPRVSGLEVLKFAKMNNSDIKVVILTGLDYLHQSVYFESKKLGADEFISKPYSLIDLLITIKRVLSSD